MNEFIVRSKRIVTADGEHPGELHIVGEKIVRVRQGDRLGEPAPGVPVVEIPDDRAVLPGLVDTHVHINEPGRTEWEGFVSATAAAAAGGVTTLVDMPLNSIPPTTNVAALELKRAAANQRVSVDVAFWGGAVPGNLDDLPRLHDAGVIGFKCFLLPSGVDEFGYLTRLELVAAMRRIADFGGLIIAHAEDAGVIDQAPAATGRSYAGFLASRPPRAEHSAIEMLMDATEETGCRTHIVHLSSAGALDRIAVARAAGLPVTVETCPHYLTLAAEGIPEGATQYKCCPPIRDAANADALWQALSEGLIDCVVSDHSPSTVDLKQLDSGDFGAAWGGIASVQLGFPVMWTEGSRRGYALSDLVRWMCSGPASFTGLSSIKGELRPGLDADFCIVAPDESLVVDPRSLLHRNPVTPYSGAKLRGVIHETWLRGERVDLAQPRGQLLQRPSKDRHRRG
ncbi:allantoinase AllB [Jatrophihabitans sp. DSM 45814]